MAGYWEGSSTPSDTTGRSAGPSGNGLPPTSSDSPSHRSCGEPASNRLSNSRKCVQTYPASCMPLRNPNTSLAVVTGASGHLGGNLVRGLLAAGQRVRAVDLRKTPALDGLNVEWCHTDLRDPGR